MAPSDPGARGGRLPRAGPGPARLRRLQPTRRRRGLRHPRPHRRPRRPAGRRRRAAGGVHRPRLGRHGRVAHRAAAPGTGPGGRGPQRAADSPAQVPPHRTLAAEVRRRLLHAALPGARPGRRRDGRRRGRHHARHVRRATDGTGVAAGLDQRRRVRPLRDRVQQDRIHRRPELVPQLRPQLGIDAAARRRTDHGARAVRRRHGRPDGPDDESRRAREVAAGPYTEKWIEGAGHWVQQERPDDVNRILLAFLREVERS